MARCLTLRLNTKNALIVLPVQTIRNAQDAAQYRYRAPPFLRHPLHIYVFALGILLPVISDDSRQRIDFLLAESDQVRIFYDVPTVLMVARIRDDASDVVKQRAVFQQRSVFRRQTVDGLERIIDLQRDL